MNHKEIAKQMSLSLSSVEKYLHSALIAVDKHMTGFNSIQSASGFEAGRFKRYEKKSK